MKNEENTSSKFLMSKDIIGKTLIVKNQNSLVKNLVTQQ